MASSLVRLHIRSGFGDCVDLDNAGIKIHHALGEKVVEWYNRIAVAPY